MQRRAVFAVQPLDLAALLADPEYVTGSKEWKTRFWDEQAS